MSRGVTPEIVNTIDSRWVRDITAGVEATTSKVNQSNALHFCCGETVNCPSVNVRISSSRLPGPDAITHGWPTIKWDGWLLSPPSPSGLLYTWTPNVVLFCSFVLFFCDRLAAHHTSPHALTVGINLHLWCPDSDLIAVCRSLWLVLNPRCLTQTTSFFFIFFVLVFCLRPCSSSLLLVPLFLLFFFFFLSYTVSFLWAASLSTFSKLIVSPAPLGKTLDYLENSVDLHKAAYLALCLQSPDPLLEFMRVKTKETPWLRV